MTILAPSCAKRIAIAAPMPWLLPVTSATFPSSFIIDIQWLEFGLEHSVELIGFKVLKIIAKRPITELGTLSIKFFMEKVT
ncbi:hypothetical protein NSMS1_03310 [Nostoc sp. MS1]|nr:hypothetical protein NSMS1_03310 [Nostoc sp. MS1]